MEEQVLTTLCDQVGPIMPGTVFLFVGGVACALSPIRAQGYLDRVLSDSRRSRHVHSLLWRSITQDPAYALSYWRSASMRKTTRSAVLAKKLQIPYFSIDHIASVIPPYIPYERQDESFPLRALRQKKRTTTMIASSRHTRQKKSSVSINDRLRPFGQEYVISSTTRLRTNTTLILEGWQLLPRFLAEIPLWYNRSDNVQIQYLYKTDVEDILSGLKANDQVNDWVLRHTREDASFIRIAQMISCFGKTIEREASELRFEAINMDCDFVRKISDLSDGMTA